MLFAQRHPPAPDTYHAVTTELRTFLFTDIEGSTRLLERLGEGYAEVLARHWKLVREPCELREGEEFGAEGDAMFFAFTSPDEALTAATEAQHSLLDHDWGPAGSVRVRMALHTGEAKHALGTWLGVAVHHAARACAAGHGAQILLTGATADLLSAPAPIRLLGEYNLRDIAGPQRLYQVQGDGLPADFPPLRTPSARVTNLPDQLTTFVGRAGEIGEIRRMIAATRLVTITGPGGAGKTRLALEAAGDAGPDFDGVWLVELADVPQGGAIVPAAARALGVGDDDLFAHLGTRHLLLVLDNCEHVVAQAATFACDVLAACPRVHVLATSREALAVPGEQRWAIPPLRMPGDAVRLFVDRALAARPDFVLTAGDEDAVVEICRRLDAIPLAIELAAARTSVLSPAQIAERLDDRFRLLSGSRRGTVSRQQTLRAVVDWSHDLLSAAEQRAFRRLGVFPGTFDLAAAAAVVGDDGLELVDSLAGKSLVTAGFPSAGSPRFWLLDTLRVYAGEALRAAGEDVEARDLHAAHFLGVAEEGGPQLMGPAQVEWLDRFETDLENFRAAIDWCVVTDPRTAVTLAGYLAPFFGIRSRLADGRALLESALRAMGEDSSFDRLRALAGVGTIARMQGDLAAARAYHEEQLRAARLMGREEEIARALSSIGNVALLEGDTEGARPLFEESLEVRRRLGVPRAIALSLNNLGVLADTEGQFEVARGYFEEHLELMRAVGDRRVVGHSLTNLAIVAVATGDLDGADALLAESITALREVGDVRAVAITLAHHSGVDRRRGRAGAALALAGEALRVLDELGDPVGVAMALENAAAALAERGLPDDGPDAAFLLGGAGTLPSGKAERGSADAATAQEVEASLRRSMGDEAFERALAGGRDADPTAVVARALDLAR